MWKAIICLLFCSLAHAETPVSAVASGILNIVMEETSRGPRPPDQICKPYIYNGVEFGKRCYPNPYYAKQVHAGAS